jgi:hypothetical protein
MFEFLIPAAASLIGSSMQSSAASSAAAQQSAAADRAAQLQKEMFEKQIGLQEPFRQAGMAGQNRLMELLGLRVPAQAGVGGAPAMRSEADLRNALASQYTTPASTRTIGGRESEYTVDVPASINEAGLAAAIRNAQAQDQAALTAYQAQQAQAAPSADFGKYARDFGMSDFQADPGYAFRLAEGQKALERTAAARGGLLSGAALKAATRYGQEAGSQEFTNAFNRYQTNRANQLNPLQSLANQAQTSANTMGSAAGQYGSNVGNLYLGQGEAQGNALLAGARSRGSAYQGIGELYGRTQPNFGSLFGGGSSASSSPAYYDPYAQFGYGSST